MYVRCTGEKKGVSRRRVGFKLGSQTSKRGRANPVSQVCGISAIPALPVKFQNWASLITLE